MEKKRIICVLCTLLLLLSVTALAVDLPVDIDIIGQVGEGGRREAVTARFGIDLFSPTADEVNQALTEQVYERREAVVSGLFEEPHTHQEVDIEAQVFQAAQESNLFAQPMQGMRAGTVEAEETFSVWLIALVLFCAAIGGFLIAQAMLSRKGREDNVSHTNT